MQLPPELQPKPPMSDSWLLWNIYQQTKRTSFWLQVIGIAVVVSIILTSISLFGS